MNKGLNKVMLVGNVGKHISSGSTQTGIKVVNVELVTNEIWGGGSARKKGVSSETHKLVFYGAIAESVEKSVVPGELVYVEGKIKSGSYAAKDGTNKISYQILCKDLIFLGGGGTASNTTSAAPDVSSQGSSDFDERDFGNQ